MNLFTRFLAILALIAAFVLIQSHANGQSYGTEAYYGDTYYDDGEAGEDEWADAGYRQINYTLIFYRPEHIAFRYRFYKPYITLYVHLGRVFWHPRPVIVYRPAYYRYVYFDPYDYIADFYHEPVIVVDLPRRPRFCWRPGGYAYGGYYSPGFHHNDHGGYFGHHGKGHKKYHYEHYYGNHQNRHNDHHNGNRGKDHRYSGPGEDRRHYADEFTRRDWGRRDEPDRRNRGSRDSHTVRNDSPARPDTPRRPERNVSDRRIQRRVPDRAGHEDTGSMDRRKQQPPLRRYHEAPDRVNTEYHGRTSRRAQTPIPGSGRRYGNGTRVSNRSEQAQKVAATQSSEQNRPQRWVDNSHSNRQERTVLRQRTVLSHKNSGDSSAPHLRTGKTGRQISKRGETTQRPVFQTNKREGRKNMAVKKKMPASDQKRGIMNHPVQTQVIAAGQND